MDFPIIFLILTIAGTIFHIAMLIKAAVRKQWVWFVLIFLFPILDLIYVFI